MIWWVDTTSRGTSACLVAVVHQILQLNRRRLQHEVEPADLAGEDADRVGLDRTVADVGGADTVRADRNAVDDVIACGIDGSREG